METLETFLKKQKQDEEMADAKAAAKSAANEQKEKEVRLLQEQFYSNIVTPALAKIRLLFSMSEKYTLDDVTKMTVIQPRSPLLRHFETFINNHRIRISFMGDGSRMMMMISASVLLKSDIDKKYVYQIDLNNPLDYNRIVADFTEGLQEVVEKATTKG